MSESGFIKVYKDNLKRMLKELKTEMEDIERKIDTKTKSHYELYIMKLEIEGAIEDLENETIESEIDIDRNLNDKFYMIRFEIEGALKSM